MLHAAYLQQSRCCLTAVLIKRAVPGGQQDHHAAGPQGPCAAAPQTPETYPSSSTCFTTGGPRCQSGGTTGQHDRHCSEQCCSPAAQRSHACAPRCQSAPHGDTCQAGFPSCSIQRRSGRLSLILTGEPSWKRKLLPSFRTRLGILFLSHP
jgi:hypothetical protein